MIYLLIIIGLIMIIYGLVSMTKNAKKRVDQQGRPVAILDIVLIGLGIVAIIAGVAMNYDQKDTDVHEIETQMNPGQDSTASDTTNFE